MAGIVLTFPILAGKVESWRRFCQELSGSRRKQYEASRQQLGITHERMELMETSYGAMAVTTLEGSDVVQALGMLIASDHSFDIWYRERLYELHGVNLVGNEQFSRLMTIPQKLETHFEWEADSDKVGDSRAKIK